MTMGAFIYYGRPTGHKLAERNFPIKPGQPKGMTLSIFLNSFFESLHKSREVERWNNLSKWNDKFQPPPEAALNIPVEMSRGGPIHLTSDWIFRNVWQWRNAPDRSVASCIAWFGMGWTRVSSASSIRNIKSWQKWQNQAKMWHDWWGTWVCVST